MDGYYDEAWVCESGHLINRSAKTWPRYNVEFCEKCGKKAVKTCEACAAPIKGAWHDSGGRDDYAVPAHCHSCGAALTWTRRADELADAIYATETLSYAEREELAKAIPDVLEVTENSRRAANLFKRAIAKLGELGDKTLVATLAKVGADRVVEWIGS